MYESKNLNMPPCGVSTQIFVLFAYKIIKLMHHDVLELWQVNLIKESSKMKNRIRNF